MAFTCERRLYQVLKKPFKSLRTWVTGTLSMENRQSLNYNDVHLSLIIITARSESQREGTEDWIMEYLPDSEYILISQQQVVLIIPSF